LSFLQVASQLSDASIYRKHEFPANLRNPYSSKRSLRSFFYHNKESNSDDHAKENFPHSNVQFNFANIQTKLKVSQPGDISEQEADRVAELVSRSSVKSEYTIPPVNQEKIHRKCANCKEEEENEEMMKISRKESTLTNSTNRIETLEDTESEISNTLNQSGSPLDSSIISAGIVFQL
jgi:hypothetical protein